MSLSAKLAKVTPDTSAAPRRGPKPTCDIYGTGTLEDWQAVEDLRNAHSWAIAQATVDKAVDIAEPIPNNFFQYHWKRKCSCWPRDLRR